MQFPCGKGVGSFGSLACLESEFRVCHDIDNINIPSDNIAMLRRQYMQDLMNDKKFIFGKYTILAGAKVPISFLEHFACSKSLLIVVLGCQIPTVPRQDLVTNICDVLQVYQRCAC